MSDLQQRAAEFLVTANEHIQKAERLLVPELDEYFRSEDVVPSIFFTNMVMEEQYRAARQLIGLFIQQVDTAPSKHGRYLIGLLQKGLDIMAKYLNVEYEFMLPPAERMTTDLEAWYF